MFVPSSSHCAVRLPSRASRRIWSIAWCETGLAAEMCRQPIPFRYAYALLWLLLVHRPPIVTDCTAATAWASAWAPSRPAPFEPGGVSIGPPAPAPGAAAVIPSGVRVGIGVADVDAAVARAAGLGGVLVFVGMIAPPRRRSRSADR